jgi:hypothetical protein
MTRRFWKALYGDKSRIAVLRIDGVKRRGSNWTKYGLDAVLEEIQQEHISIEVSQMADFDTVLFSATSPVDLFALSNALHGYQAPNLIVGGQGAYSVRCLADTGCSVFFGRAEGIVQDIIDRKNVDPYLLDFKKDPFIEGQYKIRRARYLLDGEHSVGCRHRCRFCQYSYTRNHIGSDYNPTDKGHTVVEDNWASFPIKTGRITTALDGWNAETRKRVHKPVTDQDIIDKIQQVITSIDGTMVLKVFQIAGYPWETLESVNTDIDRMSDIMARCDTIGPGRVVVMFLNTPFSPEPLTPMQYENIPLIDWRNNITGNRCRAIYKSPNLESFILPQTPGLMTLLKRVAINRGVKAEILKQMATFKGCTADQVAKTLPIIGEVYEWMEGRYCDYLTLEEKMGDTQ